MLIYHDICNSNYKNVVKKKKNYKSVNNQMPRVICARPPKQGGRIKVKKKKLTKKNEQFLTKLGLRVRRPR